MTFHYVSQVATSNFGRVALGVNEDADGATPTSFNELLQVRCAKEVTGHSSGSLEYIPRREGWLWTNDLSLNEDRLEYPGIFYLASMAFTVSVQPGATWVEADVEFDLPCSVATALFKLPTPHPREWCEGKYVPRRKNDTQAKGDEQPLTNSTVSQKCREAALPNNSALPVAQMVDSMNELVVLMKAMLIGSPGASAKEMKSEE